MTAYLIYFNQQWVGDHDVEDEEAARMWAGKLAVGCGWPQEVRRFAPLPDVP